MTARELIQNLQKQGVFRQPLFEAVRGIIGPEWTSGQPKKIPLDQLHVLCEVWQNRPAAFFKSWGLPVNVRKDDSFQPNRNGGQELPRITATDDDDTLFATYLNVPMIRFVIHAIYVHDVVLLQSRRRKAGSNLPRNLPDLVRKAWKINNGEEASSSVIGSLVDYVKAGSMCLRVGATIGEASWFLIPQSLFEMTRFPSDTKLAQLKCAIPQLKLANEAAKTIREHQLGPRLPKRPRQKSEYLCGRTIAIRISETHTQPMHHPRESTLLDWSGTDDLQSGLYITGSPKDRHNNSFPLSHCESLPGNAWNSVSHTTSYRQLLPEELISSCLPPGVWDEAFSTEPPPMLLGETWNNVFSAEPSPMLLGEVWNNVFSGEPAPKLPAARRSVEHPLLP